MPELVSTGEPSPDDVSALLRAWTDGDQRALARITPIVYDELHRLAHYFLKRERAGHSLQTTALVNEAYMRLVDYKDSVDNAADRYARAWGGRDRGPIHCATWPGSGAAGRERRAG